MRPSLRFAKALAMLLTFAPGLTAADYEWKGTGTVAAPTGGNWDAGTHWAGGFSPASSDENLLKFGGSANYTATNNLGAADAVFGLNRIEFLNSAGTVTVARAGTRSIEFASNWSATPSISLSGTGNATLSTPIALSQDVAVDLSGGGLLTLSEVISSTGGLTVTGGGSLHLSASNSFTGAVVMNGTGTLTAANNNAFSSLTLNSGKYVGSVKSGVFGSGTIYLSGGDLELAPDVSNQGGGYARPWVVTKDAIITLNRSNSGEFNNTMGTLSLNGSRLTYERGANVTGTNPARLTHGAATLTGNGSIATASGVRVTLASLTGSGMHFIADSDGELLISGAVSTGTGSVTQTGSGILQLNGAASYTGATIISNGTLVLGASATLASKQIQIGPGAEFDVSAKSSFSFANANLTLQINGANAGLVSGQSLAFGTAALTFNLASSAMGSWDLFDLTAHTGDFSSVSLTGAFHLGLSLTGSNLWTGSQGSWTFEFNENTGVFTAIPEPGMIPLLIVAGGLLAGIRQRDRLMKERGWSCQ